MLLRFSEAASMALHAAALMAQDPDRRWVVREVADRLGVSEAHLAKVLQRLGKAGLVMARRGPGGGYTMARDPGDVTLFDVYDAIDGPYRDAGCLFAVPRCAGGDCLLGGLLADVNQTVCERLIATSVAEAARVFPLGSPSPAERA